MPKVLYSLGVLYFSNVLVYFYCYTSTFLIVLIISTCSSLIWFKISLEDFKIKETNSKRKESLNKTKEALQNCIDRRKLQNQRMSSFHKRSSVSGGDESSFDSGLLSNYDSRRLRTSIQSSDTSPLRTFSRLNGISGDENFHSKQSFSPTRHRVFSPTRTLVSSMRPTPFSHSKRYNSIQQEEESFQSQSTLSREDSLFRASPSSLTKKQNSLSSLSAESSGFVSMLAATANQMKLNDFPRIGPSAPIIPLMPTSASKTISSPSNRRNDSSLRDYSSVTPRRNRVRVRLAGPNQSDISLNGSSHDLSSNLEDSYTTKSVIQVLKEISRKRAYTPTEDEEEQQETKRRPEHNLYLSRLENEEENPIPSRTINEDDRKRVREPDWDTPNIAGPKRRRKNTHIVNNEILSSLSSSIGLHLIHSKPAVERQKQTVSIGTQASLLKDSPDKKHNEQAAQTNISKDVKEAGTMPDPPPPPRPRSPVKEKVVTDLNGILKSALSKFNILPKEGSNKCEEILSSPSSPFATKLDGISPGITSKIAETVSSTNPVVSTGSTSQTNKSLNQGVQEGFASQANTFMLPVSSPNVTFGTSPLTFSGKNSEKSSEELPKSSETSKTGSKPDLVGKKDESKPELGGFKFIAPVEAPKSVSSPFTFGSQPQTSVAQESLTPGANKVATGFKMPEVNNTASTQSPIAQPAFSFGKSTTENSASVTTTSSTTTALPATASPLQIPQASSTSLVPTVPSNEPPKNEPFKFTSGFGTLNKATEGKEQPTEEKKETAVFSFGKPEDKPASNIEKADNKPFQFGTGVFGFGQNASQNKETPSNNIFVNNTKTSLTTTQPSSDNKKPVFSFSGSTEKKDEKPGGFSFKIPNSNATTSGENKPVFSFINTQTSTPANTTVTGTIVSSSSSDTKPIFPASLFGTTTSSTTMTSSPATTIANTSVVPTPTSINTTNAFGSGSTFGSLANDSGKPLNTTTNTTPASTFGSISSPFGSGNKTVFGSNPTTKANSTSLFNTTLTNNQTTNSSIFGSSNTTAFPTTTPTAAFGTTVSTTSNVSFGSTATVSAPSFGNPTTTTAPSFGSTTTPSSTFGSTAPNTNTPGFGNTTAAGSNAPVFGTTIATTTASAFGATNANTPSFGNIQTTNAPIFGSSNTGNTASTFGGTTSTFGSTPAVGSSVPPFGTTNSTPAFGTATTPAFGGSSSATAPAFGSQQQGFGNQAATTFGGTPAFGQSTTPLFGASNTFGNQSSTPAFGTTGAFGTSSSTFSATTPVAPAFGSTSVTQTPSAPAFGSASATPTPAPAFGSASATPTPAPAFGTSATPTPAPAFGSTSATFGSTPAFGVQDANKPFSFNAPATQPAATSGFNFTAQQQPQAASGGLFQFGASTSQPGQPFQFNAAQPNATGFTAGFSPGVGGSGQQMFSIGSGSTAPRRVTARRKK